MQVIGTVTQVFPPVTGTGSNGTWKKQQIILQYQDHFIRNLCISFFNDKIREEFLQVGLTVKVDFDLESREYNGRWYTDVKAWKIEPAAQEDKKTVEPVNVAVEETEMRGITVEDDLPF